MSRLSNLFYGTLDGLAADLELGGTGPCLVVGSAPTAERPAGYDISWRLLCMNGSPAVAARLGLATPDVVLLRGGLFGDRVVDREAQEALRGQSAKTVLLRNMHGERGPNETRLREIGYKFERARPLPNNERSRLIHEALGLITGVRLGRKDISAGLICVMLAAALGKAPIVITGISLAVKGHYYSSSNLHRRHVRKDRLALLTMVRRGVPLFTTDPVLAKEIGMPIWNDHQWNNHDHAIAAQTGVQAASGLIG